MFEIGGLEGRISIIDDKFKVWLWKLENNVSIREWMWKVRLGIEELVEWIIYVEVEIFERW